MLNKGRIAKHLILAGLLFITVFFDNYVSPPGYRPFDFIGMALIMAGVALSPTRLNAKMVPSLFNASVLALTVIYTIPIGILVYNSTSFIPFLLGILLYFTVIKSRVFHVLFIPYVKYTLIIISAGIIVQFAVYLATGDLISFTYFASEEVPRGYNPSWVVRPSGFYIEPGSHALVAFVFLMLYLTINGNKFDFTTIVSLLGILISLSFAGILATILALVAMAFLQRRLLHLSISLSMVIVVMIIIYLAPTIENFDISLAIIERFHQVSSGADGSAIDRVGKLDSTCINYMLNENPILPFVGGGLTSLDFKEYCGQNNIVWALFCYGFIIPIIYLYRIVRKFIIYPLVVLSIFYILLSGTLSSYFFVWVYFAGMMGPFYRHLKSRIRMPPLGYGQSPSRSIGHA